MPLGEVAALAAICGAAEALGVSGSGAEVAAAVALDRGGAFGAHDLARGPGVGAAIAFAAALGIGVATRKHISVMVAQGVRAIARPELLRSAPLGREAAMLVVALGASATAHLATRAMFSPWQASPLATGAGLVVTGLGLASVALARNAAAGARNAAGGARNAAAGARGAEAPNLGAALVAGVAHGASGCPGASRLTAAFVVLIWFGLRPARAVEFALVLSCTTLLASATASAFAGGERADFVAASTAFGATFVAALAGATGLQMLAARRRIEALALWALPVGLALLAYAKALPGS